MSKTDPTSKHASRVIKTVRRELQSVCAPHVLSSWERCLGDYGIHPDLARDTVVIGAGGLRERQQRLATLLEVAQPEMENLYEQISGSGYVVLIADADATILHAIVDPNLTREFRRVGIWMGAVWDERSEGTNGIGTAIAERAPVTVNGDEHFMGYNIGMSCSGAPIFDAHGSLIGVLDATTAKSNESREIQRHRLRLVAMSAQLITRQHFLREFEDAVLLRFHSRPEFVGLLQEALVAISNDGNVLAVNDSAMAQLGHVDRDSLVGQPVESLFQFSLPTLLQRARNDPRTLWPIRDVGHGRRFFALAQARTPASARRIAPARGVPAATAPIDDGWRNRVGTDPLVQRNLDCAQQLFARSVPILVLGATGTGKEVFARTLHDGSAWAGKPFVAVNCAAIPESLIESELFGYTRGAFTDADRHGRPGKILQSSGGTLFLDEIGDMPLVLQTRLLRVMEQFEVVPLGGDRAIQVELHVISASHRDIRRMVADGEFREDLYYRLNGMTLNLPRLRQRSDRAALVETLLREESHGIDETTVHADALRVLMAYHWPGNIRQLRNVLRSAAALCEGRVIRLSNLPQELVDAVASSPLTPDTAESIDLSGTPTLPARSPLESAERTALVQELERCRWNISRTAKALGVGRNTLYRKMRKHRIALPE